MSSSSPQSPPDPLGARTSAHYVELLRRLRLSSGLTYRQLARATARQGRPIPHSTIASTLARDRLPREEFLVAVVRACGCDTATVDRWLAAHRRLARQDPVTPGAESHERPADPPARRTEGPLQLRKSVPGQSLLALIIGLSAGLFLSSAAKVPICPDQAPPTPAPAAAWQFEEENDSVAIDSSGRGRHPAIEGNATRKAVTGGHALELDGRGPVISIQDGAYDVVLLSFVPATGRWELTYREQTNGRAPGGTTLSGVLPTESGRWTHVGAVHDVRAGQVRLYVNGHLSTSR